MSPNPDMAAPTGTAVQSGTVGTRRDAAQIVFNITELAEAILEKAPMFELFVVQRTCKAFRNTIRDSSLLRKKMFLESQKGELLVWINPLIGSGPHLPFFITKWSESTGNADDGLLRRPPRAPFPRNFSFEIGSERSTNKPVRQTRRQLPWRQETAATESWREMLVTSSGLPISATLCSAGARKYTKKHQQNTKHWKQGEGVRMGELYDFLEKQYRVHQMRLAEKARQDEVERWREDYRKKDVSQRMPVKKALGWRR